MLLAGVALLVAFVFWERKYHNPLMPPQIWKDRNFSMVCCFPFRPLGLYAMHMV